MIIKRCSSCKQEKELEQYYKDSKAPFGKSYQCKECSKANVRKYNKININNIKVQQQKRNSWIKYTYNISAQEYDDRLKQQHYKCAICKIDLMNIKRNAHLDHNHSTEKLRDFLCTNCNHGVGSFHEDVNKMQKAIAYLQRHAS